MKVNGQALNEYQQALVVRREVGTTLNNIGLVYQAQGQYDQVLNQYRSVLVIAREIGNRAGEGATLNNLGLVYRAQGSTTRP